MILPIEQIYRYMRHIAIPEISGPGQKKILDSSLNIICKNATEAAPALYYLAASGVGSINCRFADDAGSLELLSRLSDLNSDTKIQLNSDELIDNTGRLTTSRIITGNLEFVNKVLNNLIASGNNEEYIPTIISVHNGWKGVIRTMKNYSDYLEFTAAVGDYEDCNDDSCEACISDVISGFFSSLMAVVEHLKLALSLGKPIAEALYYDLSLMEFSFISTPSDLLNKLHNPKEDEKHFNAMKDSKVLIIGCGGLGSPAAMALTASGIGKLGLVDFDNVELSNLNRQIMHSTSRIGMPKVQSAEIFLKQINPKVELETYNTKIDKENIMNIIKGYDVIIGGLDNLPARYILNDACYSAGKPLIEAGALDISGLSTTILPGDGHCYRCIFPESDDNSSVPSCSETGVLGPVPGIMGIIQAAEAVKLITGTGRTLKNSILLIDVFDTDIFVADHAKNKYCELCGNP